MGEGALEIPSPEVLEVMEAPDVGEAERVFPAEILEPGRRRSPGKWCFGREVLKVPPCLVRGLSLGDPCGRWALALRTPKRDGKTLERWSRNIWNKWVAD